MSGTRRVIVALRRATVLAGGVLGVHQLYYLAGYRADASRALGDQGHAYLEGLLPLLVTLAGLTVLATALAGFAGARGADARRTPLGRALVYATAILALFMVQEVAEGALVSGHLSGIGALVAHGGPVAIALGLGFGSLSWLAVRGLEALEQRLAALTSRLPRCPERSDPRPAWAGFAVILGAPAAGAAPRAPPSA